jgi:hypothetical protein
MHIGPFMLQWWHLLLILAGLAGLTWFILSFFVRVTGTWERVDEDAVIGSVERITLIQFGPFVRGRRAMSGGFQEFNGMLRGRSIVLTRRDHGQQMIVDQGFPAVVANEIDGTVTAAMRMTLSADGQVIHGTFSPQKIEFTHNPPQITARRFLDPSFRRYKLVSRTPVDTEVIENKKKTSPGQMRRTY